MEAIDLSGTELIFTGANEAGFEDIGNLSITSKSNNYSAAVNLVLELQFMMNFKIKIIPAYDYFPDFPEIFNFTNSTIAYHLITGRADIAIGSLYHILPRAKFGCPVITYHTEGIHVFFQQPTNIMEQGDVFQKPIKLDLAVGMVLTLFGIGTLAEFSKCLKVSGVHCIQYLLKGWEWAVATLCSQAVQNKKWVGRRDYVKIMLFLGMMLSVWLNVYYSAAILSYFTREEEIIRKFADLAPAGFSIDAFYSVKSTFPRESENHPLIQFLGVGYRTSIQLVYAGNHAHLDSSESFFKYSAKVGKSVEKICTVSRLPFNTGNLRGGFYCRFGFPYAEEFAVGIHKLREAGIIKRYLTIEKIAVTITCTATVRKKYHDNLGLKEVWILYKFYISASLISLFFTIIEFLFVHSKKFYYRIFANR
ncbi:uncharacterized protein LOC110860371 isoform X2 [Folsomia candida]|nr:uncharacterized protein LOC110860371 isoform X2 [Folsomia candida]